MTLTPESTLAELLQAGFTVTTPLGFELRGKPADRDLSMRQPTPAGPTSAGHYPLSNVGIFLACGDANSYDDVIGRELASAI